MLKWIKSRAEKNGLFMMFAAIVGTAAGLTYFYEVFSLDKHFPLLWAMTVTFFFGIFVLLLGYCVYAQGIERDEVRRCAEAKSKLEAAVLKRRKSSKGAPS